MLLATLSIVLAFPLSVVVALGRRSNLPAIKTVCVIYVELIRGVPLISVLFMASFMFPLFMPPGTSIDVLLRVLVGITLFAARLHGRDRARRPAGHSRRASRRRPTRWA